MPAPELHLPQYPDFLIPTREDDVCACPFFSGWLANAEEAAANLTGYLVNFDQSSSILPFDTVSG